MDTPQKRLDQEDQDASDDDEDEKRIRFSGVKNKTQRQKIAEEIGIALSSWLLTYTDLVLNVCVLLQVLREVMMKLWMQQVRMRRWADGSRSRSEKELVYLR